HGDRSPASGRSPARGLVHARLVLAAARRADDVHRAAADGGMARLPALGLRERGARPRAPPGRPVARGPRRRGARGGPWAAPRYIRRVGAARRPPPRRRDPPLARPLPEPPLQARPDERL